MVSGQPPGAPHTPERWLQGQIRDWLARHRLMPDTQARRFAHVVAVFCSRCAPAPEPAALAPAGSRGDAADAHAEARLSAAKLVALVFTLDELALAPDDGDAPDAFESFSRRLASALGDDDDDDNDDNDDDPRLAALGDFLAALPQHPRAGREALRAAVLDYLDAAREEAWLGRGADARARGAGRDWLGDGRLADDRRFATALGGVGRGLGLGGAAGEREKDERGPADRSHEGERTRSAPRRSLAMLEPCSGGSPCSPCSPASWSAAWAMAPVPAARCRATRSSSTTPASTAPTG